MSPVPVVLPSDYERDVVPFVRPFTDALVASLPTGAIAALFDHGAGTGEVAGAVLAARNVASAVVLDPDPRMAATLRARFISPAVHVLEAPLSAVEASLTASRFDLVTSQLVLPFVAAPDDEL